MIYHLKCTVFGESVKCKESTQYDLRMKEIFKMDKKAISINGHTASNSWRPFIHIYD